MREPTPSITDLPAAPLDDQRRRMVTYSIYMSIRIVCIIIFFLVPGWWKLVPGLIAVFIPYFAVTLANATGALATKPERAHPREIGH